jgi:Holliday junction DNA helicase RuvA
MISRITGKLIALKEDRATVENDGIGYDILIPSSTLQRLREMRGKQITFYTFHYLEGGMGISNPIPRLAGFLSELDREFFEKFITVRGMGIRTALKATSAPVQAIARAIEGKDVAALSSLPGIGKRTAEKIIAELNGKLAKFALIRDTEPTAGEPAEEPDFKDEVVDVLLQLGYSVGEAEVLLRQALSAGGRAETAEELIQQIFKELHGSKEK